MASNGEHIHVLRVQVVADVRNHCATKLGDYGEWDGKWLHVHVLRVQVVVDVRNHRTTNLGDYGEWDGKWYIVP